MSRKFDLARLLAAVLVMGLLLSASVACSDRGGDNEPTPTAAASVSPTALSSATNVAPTAASSPSATATSAAQAQGPAIEWMMLQSAGAGAVVVRVATDVPTTLVLSIVRDAPDPLAPNATATSSAPARLHTASLAAGQTDFVVQAVVTDAQGRTLTGLLETGAIAGRQYWGRNEFAPKLTLGGQLRAEATWTNLRSSGEPNLPARIALLQRQAGCTVAQQCESQFARAFENDQVGGDAASETHRIAFTFPDNAHDFTVVLIGRSSATSSVRHFYQFDVLSAELK